MDKDRIGSHVLYSQVKSATDSIFGERFFVLQITACYLRNEEVKTHIMSNPCQTIIRPIKRLL